MIALMRPKQWLKNLFVFAPLLFSGLLLNATAILNSITSALAFCLVASAVYIFNDILDRERDRRHPTKRNRPIASGAVSAPQGIALMAVLLVGGFSLALFVVDQTTLALVLVTYVLMNVLYSTKLKQVAIIDIICVALGFVLRVVAGGVSVPCHVSPWIVSCTFLLALFLAAQKRYGEIKDSDGTEIGSRVVLKYYSEGLLDQIIPVCSTLTIVSYTMYALLASANEYMLVTVLFVIYGLFRYQLIAKNLGGVEAPERIFIKDKALLADVALWALCCAALLYF